MIRTITLIGFGLGLLSLILISVDIRAAFLVGLVGVIVSGYALATSK